MSWVRHFTVGLFVICAMLPLASAQERQGRPPRADSRESRTAPAAPNAPGQLGVEVSIDEVGRVRVEGFAPGSPAERVGMRTGDRVVAVEGRAVDSVERVVELVRARPAGSEIKLRLRRTVVLRLDDRQRTEDGRLALGLVLGGEDGGLEVSSAPAGYAAAAAGLAAGDRVVELDGVDLANQGQLVERMRRLGAARSVRLSFERDVRVRLGAADAQDAPAPEPEARGARRRGAVAPLPAREPAMRDVAGEVAALRRELAALRAELAELRKLLGDELSAGSKGR
ncbi:MAG: PDZ domain-containing protein [Planctomycetes bacterium]|nr:PDZ domain-containing protein [Planctomycetota bacterium]